MIRLSLVNIQTFPWIADRVKAGGLTLTGYRFDIATGRLWRMTRAGSEPVEPEL